MQLANTGRVAHFAKGFGFDLADSFARDAELPPHFFQCPRISVAQTKTQLQHFPFPF